jgi:hypothetical protein
MNTTNALKTADIRLELTNMVFTSTLVLYPTDLPMREDGQPSKL